jgi:hypothetical protein
VQNLPEIERLITLLPSKTIVMKKMLAFVALVGMLASCSQYTCPTYAKKEVKKQTEQKNI